MWSKVVVEETQTLDWDDVNIGLVDYDIDNESAAGDGYTLGSSCSSMTCTSEELVGGDDIPTTPRRKGGLKRSSSLGSRKGSPCKKRVRWQDLEEGSSDDWQCRPCAHRKLLVAAVLVMVVFAFVTMRTEISEPVTTKLRAHLRRIGGAPPVAFLRFQYQSGGRDMTTLALDDHSNVVFSRDALSASGEDAFHVRGSNILLHEAGLYLFVIHYKHRHSNITLDAQLPFESETRSFLLHGARNSLYHHCIVSQPQNISVAVRSQLQDRAKHVDFRSLLLEVTRLSHELPQKPSLRGTT